MTLAERFEGFVERVPFHPCWEWSGARNKGYGLIFSGIRNAAPLRAHRVSWELEHGEIPKGMHVLHRCDNPSCVNPAHLFLGTNADNQQDRSRKGRFGRKHLDALLASAQISAQRRRSKTHCKRGHPRTPESTRSYTNRAGYVCRDCIECKRIAAKNRRLEVTS